MWRTVWQQRKELAMQKTTGNHIMKKGLGAGKKKKA